LRAALDNSTAAAVSLAIVYALFEQLNCVSETRGTFPAFRSWQTLVICTAVTLYRAIGCQSELSVVITLAPIPEVESV